MTLALFFLFAGCVPTPVDADGDGVDAAADCDDADAAVHPGAEERCGGGDEDCDGLTDDDDPSVGDDGTIRAWEDSDGDGFGDPGSDGFFCDVPRDYVLDATDCDDADAGVGGASDWYLDSDGDRYGDSTRTETSCDPSPGYVADGTDCDDAQADVSPSARERCDGVDNDCDGTVDEDDAEDASTWYLDADGDGHGDMGATRVSCEVAAGYVGDAADCDDARADVSPSLREICDAADTDQDCDGLADDADPDTLADGMRSYYPDTDADGYGDGSVGVLACDMPAGHVADSADCDDTYAAAHPGGTEVCDADNHDEDCNGAWDDYDPGVDPATRTTWYFDLDRDGYGNPDTTIFVQCEQLYGTIGNADDCDDGDAAVSPAATEVCDAADFDEDCDRLADDADASVDAATFGTFYADTDGDGYGEEAVTSASCDATVGYVAEYGDCNLADPTISPGSPELCGDGVDDNCDGSTNCDLLMDDAVRTFTGINASDGVGVDVASAGDVNGDGWDDMLVSSIAYGTRAGAAWLVAGGATGDLSLSAATATLVGEETGDYAGYCATGIGDLDSDGYDDIVVGAPLTENGRTSQGTAYVVRGPVTGTVNLSTAYASFTGETSSSSAGSNCAAAGDVDGDGVGDLLIADHAYSSSRGAIYLLTSVSAGTTALSSATARMYGDTGSSAGWSLDGAGDVNGDGFDDIVIGAHNAYASGSQSGISYVVLGPQTGSLTLSGADAVLPGESAVDHAGISVRGVGDIDDDGYDDVAIGASGFGDYGAVYLLSGPVDASSSLATANARIESAEGGTIGSWRQVDGADYDADGISDLALGNTGYGPSGNEGAFYVFRGPLAGSYTTDDADVRLHGDEEDAYIGRLAFVGAQDGRPGYDLFTVAPSSDEGAEDAGAAYLFSLAGL
jgi:hypothetical protein